ncbi:MAG TPA: tetratricopeptide repeat protein, partial [Longimicrobiales bacterium]|nr:tetratricopeptide repeat protein [Longimicrobiales bacterium]
GLEPRLAVGRDRLVAAGIGEGTASSIRALVDRLAAARYAPTPLPPSARRELLRGADRLLERVDAEAPWPAPGVDGSGRGTRAARGPGVRAGMLVPFLLLTAAASGGAIGVEGRPAVAQSPGDAAPAETFQRGVDAFDAGEHAEAVALFRQFVTSNPEDAAGWYNLGTAYHQAGESGAAIWAWLHVPRLDPRDRDTRHNLRVAGASPELVRRAAPAVPLRVSELMLLASIMWFITGGAGAWWILRRGRLPGAVAAVGLALIVAVGAALMEATRSPETLVALDHTTLQAGPVLRGEVVDEVEAGAGLIPVSRRDEWLRVRTLSGREGWLEDRFVGALPK